MIIERLKPEDIEGLLELYKELMSHENDREKSLEIYEEMLKDDKYLLVVAKEDGKIVGTALAICCMLVGYAGRSFMVVEDVVVKSDMRGRGIGKKIMEYINKFAEEKNCGYTILVSQERRKDAHRFYENAGFTEPVRGFKKYN